MSPRLIRITALDGDPIYLNPEMVTYVTRDAEGLTYVQAGCSRFCVQEDVVEMACLIVDPDGEGE